MAVVEPEVAAVDQPESVDMAVAPVVVAADTLPEVAAVAARAEPELPAQPVLPVVMDNPVPMANPVDPVTTVPQASRPAKLNNRAAVADATPALLDPLDLPATQVPPETPEPQDKAADKLLPDPLAQLDHPDPTATPANPAALANPVHPVNSPKAATAKAHPDHKAHPASPVNPVAPDNLALRLPDPLAQPETQDHPDLLVATEMLVLLATMVLVAAAEPATTAHPHVPHQDIKPRRISNISYHYNRSRATFCVFL